MLRRIALAVLLASVPLWAFPVAPACDTSRLEPWSVNPDGGDGLAFRIESDGGAPYLALDFTCGAKRWGNLATAVTLAPDAIGLRLRVRVREAAPEAGFYVHLIEKDGDTHLERVYFDGKGPAEAGKEWRTVFLPLAHFAFLPRGNQTKELMTVERLLLGCSHDSQKIDVRAIEFVRVTPAAAPFAFPAQTAAPRAVILDGANLPRRGAPADPRRLEKLLSGNGLEAFVLSAEQLSSADLSSVDLLVLPLGPVFPAPATQNLRAFLARGGSLLTTGGYAFDMPVVPLDDGTFVEAMSAVPAAKIGAVVEPESINTRFGKVGDTLGLRPEQIGMFDPSDRFERAVRIEGGSVALQGAFAGSSAVGLVGTNNPVAPRVTARWQPLLAARDRYGRECGPAAGLLTHFEEGSAALRGAWAFFGVDNADLFAPGALPDDYVVRLARTCAARVSVRGLRPLLNCYRPGETAECRFALGNFGRAPARVRLVVQAMGKEVHVRERELAAGENAEESFSVPAPTAEGVYPVRVAYTLLPENAFVAEAPLESAFCVWDPATGVEGPVLHFVENRMLVYCRTVFLAGTNQTGVAFTPGLEDPLVWSRQFARQRDHALNVVRYLHFGIRAEQLARDVPDEWLCRTTDALVYCLARHDQIPMLTLHDWLPVALDAQGLEAQKKWAKFWSSRYSKVSGFLFDIQNEPAVTVEDTPLLRGLLKEFEAARALENAPDPARILGAAALGWDDRAGELREEFRLWLHERWTGANAAGVRAGDPTARVTVGLLPWNGPIDKARGYAGMDFACYHFYGALPDLAVETKWADRSIAGQGLTFGEFGAQEAHDARVRGQSGEFAPESIRRYTYTLLVGAGLGATMALNWDIQEKPWTVFPWGLAHRDGRPKQVLRAYRALSLFLRTFGLGEIAPKAVLLLGSAKRFSAGKDAIDAAIGTSIRTLLHCGVPFALANEDDERAGNLAELPKDVALLPLPAASDKAALDAAYADFNRELVARFGPRRPTMRISVPLDGEGTLTVIANPGSAPQAVAREEGIALALPALAACAVHANEDGKACGLVGYGDVELPSGAKLTLPSPSVLFALHDSSIENAGVLVLSPLAEGTFACRPAAPGFPAYAVGEIVDGKFVIYEQGEFKDASAPELEIDAERRGCLILLGPKERFTSVGEMLCALTGLQVVPTIRLRTGGEGATEAEPRR